VFKNLRTSTKLALLCAMFIISVGATTYSLVAEKLIAIAFARKELVGTTYLAAARAVYAAVLAGPPISASPPPAVGLTDDLLRTLAAEQTHVGARLQTGEAEEAVAGALRVWSTNPAGAGAYGFAQDALVRAGQLVLSIADGSNLTLDPDLDTYYLQDLITTKLPAFVRQLSELQILSRQAATAGTPSNEQKIRFQILEGLFRSITDEVNGNLAAAYRGDSDGSLRQAVGGAFAGMMSSTNAYLHGLSASLLDSDAAKRDFTAPDRLYDNVVESMMGAWATARSELDRLLQKRIDDLLRRMRLSLWLTGALTGLSIIIAIMTHRHIVRPLERLEQVASRVRETKDYSLRSDHTSEDEIGRLSGAFNDMLGELAAARERERTRHSEVARVARLTTMGAMTASIAHEINQPLAAIVTNSNAAQRWLARAEPNLEEARTALTSIAEDGHRASQVIGSVRAMFKKDSQKRSELAVNDVIEDVLVLVRGEIQRGGVSLRTELLPDLPHVVADRTQLQQVFLNLIMNAVEAMGAVSNRERLLVVKSDVHDPKTVMIMVEDSGTGIDPSEAERIFDAFFTTKSDGMGMGLVICRSIIEAHGGRLWASPGVPRGTAFHVVLPSAKGS
jgi:signal transduction histidine kinase